MIAHDKIARVLRNARLNMIPNARMEPDIDEALATLAELERAAAEPEPVAWMWNDELGIPHVSAGQKKPVWVENGLSSHMAKIVNLRPLYAAPPAPVAEIREPTDDECRNIWREAKANEGDGSKVYAGRASSMAVSCDDGN